LHTLYLQITTTGFKKAEKHSEISVYSIIIHYLQTHIKSMSTRMKSIKQPWNL